MRRPRAADRDGIVAVWWFATVFVTALGLTMGGGIPLLPAPAGRTALALRSHRVYPSGIVLLEYDVR